jgi:hypothetical protein
VEVAIPLAIFVLVMAALHPITKRRHEEQGRNGPSLAAQYVSIAVMVVALMAAAALLDGTAMVVVVLGTAVTFVAVAVTLDRRSAR